METPRSSAVCVSTQFSATVFFSFPVQIYSNRELEEQLTKIRDALSDDKHDWELRVAAVRVPRMPPADLLSYRWNSDYKDTCVLFRLCSWRRSVLWCWLGRPSLRASLSNFVSSKLPWNYRPKTCGRRWSGRPVSHWGKNPQQVIMLPPTGDNQSVHPPLIFNSNCYQRGCDRRVRKLSISYINELTLVWRREVQKYQSAKFKSKPWWGGTKLNASERAEGWLMYRNNTNLPLHYQSSA